MWTSYRDVPVLVTGHTGFKGAWLSQILINLGARVSGYALPPEQPSLFSALALDIPQCLHDIRDVKTLDGFVQQQKPKIIFHLAAQALVSVGRKQPLDTFSTNIMGLANVLETAVRHRVEAVVVVSTDKVYAPQDQPCTLRSPLGGKDPYSASKTAAEFLVPAYQDRIHISISRSGNAMGGGDWGTDRLIPDIMRAHHAKKPLHIRNPNATRPWLHVSELIRAYLMLGLWNREGRHCRPFNFGGEVSLSVKDILQYLKSKKISPSIIYGSDVLFETQTLDLQSTETTELLGWKNRISSRKALDWTVEEYELLHKADVLKNRMWDRMGFTEMDRAT